MDGLTHRAALSVAEARLPEALELLASLVDVNSHADNADGVQRCLDLIGAQATRLGLVPQKRRARAPRPRDPETMLDRVHLVAETAAVPGVPTVLLLGHVDTVFPVDHPFQRLERSGDNWQGPGVSDMKGGLVTALETLALLERSGARARARFRLCVIADEEQGSPTGLQVLKEAARGADVALSFEAARPCGGLVVRRKGYGSLRAVVRGRTGHAGIAHDTAVNALTALARFVVGAEALEAVFDGLTVSPGGVVAVSPPSLGSVPDLAQCEIEWRFDRLEDGERAAAALESLARVVGQKSGATLTLDGGVDVPPMNAGCRSEGLLGYYVEAARALGLEISGVATAGVGDINQVAASGAICLDGVGPEGGGFHTEDEFLVASSIARRAAMNALAITRWLEERRHA